MTGGRVVILGATGRNFAAGMSGGVAYVYDPENKFDGLCNTEMVLLEKVETAEEDAELKLMIEKHVQYTNSPAAALILASWSERISEFVKVMPTEYKKVLEKARIAALASPTSRAVLEAEDGVDGEALTPKLAFGELTPTAAKPTTTGAKSACGAADKLDIEDMGDAVKHTAPRSLVRSAPAHLGC